MASDAELFTAWRGGDSAAGDRLFNRYFVPISRFFVNKVPGEPDDLIQETFVALLRGRQRLRESTSFRSYLFASAFNVLRNYFGRCRRDAKLGSLSEISAVDLAPGPSTVAHAREEERHLLDALRGIPVQHQVVLELHYWEQMTTEEIGTVLDTPTGTIRSQLRRGRALLHERLQQMPLSAKTRTAMLADLEGWAQGLRETVTSRCA